MVNNEAYCEVDEILNSRVGTDGKTEYLIKWKDEPSDDEWVRADLCNCPKSIAEYEKSIGDWNEEYEVEGIIDSIEDEDDNIEYLVKWKRYPYEECRWVKEVDMKCNDLIKDFKKGEKYESDRTIKVVEILPGTSTEANGTEYFKIREEDEDGNEAIRNELFSIDEIYVLPNGRKALIDYYGQFI